jgi:enoyl-CoA hydratase/carnithine racemase
MSDDVLIDEAGGVLTLTFNRPDRKNAMTRAMYRTMAEAIEQANDERRIRAILFQANGESFSAGHDIAELAQLNMGAAGAQPTTEEPFLEALARAKKPLVAAAHGRSVGIGLTLLLHCDLVYVAEDALFSCPFTGLALTPEAASSLLLPARIGHVRAFQLFVMGEAIDGRTAAAWGLANEALPAGEVQARARAAAEALAVMPPAAVALTKKLMRDTPAVSQRITEELALFTAQLCSPEAAEAFTAFLQKRPADFSRF